MLSLVGAVSCEAMGSSFVAASGMNLTKSVPPPMSLCFEGSLPGPPPWCRERGEPDEIWLKSSSLPDYFQAGFHYQTDGWLSARASVGVPKWLRQVALLGKAAVAAAGGVASEECTRPGGTSCVCCVRASATSLCAWPAVGWQSSQTRWLAALALCMLADFPLLPSLILCRVPASTRPAPRHCSLGARMPCSGAR